MKAIEAINAIIILVLGVLTLLAILGLFLGVWTPAKSGTSLQAATQTTCAKINPAFCKDSSRAARMPVFDFNANNQDGINEHTTDPATGCVAKNQDTFEELCHYYYGGPASWAPPGSEEQFIDKCMVQVCGCPKYSLATYLHGC